MIELDEERLEFMRGPNQRPVLQQFYYTVALVENDWCGMWVFDVFLYVCVCVSICIWISNVSGMFCFFLSERLWFDEGIMSSRMCMPMSLGWLIWDWYRARCKCFDRLNWKWMCLWSKSHYLSMVCQIWRTKNCSQSVCHVSMLDDDWVNLKTQNWKQLITSATFCDITGPFRSKNKNRQTDRQRKKITQKTLWVIIVY